MTPLLLRSGLTGRVYVVTRYKVLDAEKGRIEAITKYDVTDQYEALAKTDPRPQPRPSRQYTDASGYAEHLLP